MWQRIKTWFADSETIFWARFQMLLGIIAGVVTYADPYLLAPVMGDWFPWFLAINGLATEYLRRRRADDL